jgi:signal transduction histidine kinase
MNTSSTTPRTLARLQLLRRIQGDGSTARPQLEQLLAEMIEALELTGATVRWPVTGTPEVHVGRGETVLDGPSTWGPETTARLGGARSSDETFIDPQRPHRLLVPLIVDGLRNGVLSALTREPMNEEDHCTLIIVAHCLVRHPAFVDLIGASIDRLRVSQRLQDASVVAGRIAHDFDNIFTGVVGFAEMVQSMLEADGLQHQYVSEIVSAANRGIEFTKQLHQLSRSGAPRVSATSVSNALAREEARLRKNASLNVKLQFASPNDLPHVAIDASALQQVLGSLLDNAVEASPPAGAVRVCASLIELSDEQAREYLGAASAGPFVELRISDEGPGIRNDHRKKLFVEPFFTTKVRHRGLGLPVVLRVLTALRGGVRYEVSARGSAFHVVLPLAAAHVPEQGGAL